MRPRRGAPPAEEPPAEAAPPTSRGEPAAGDERSFTEFYEASWHTVTRGLAVTLGDEDLAAEATDEAMVRAYQRWRTVRHYDAPAGWVYRVGLNWARSYHRRARRQFPFARPDRVEPPPMADPSVAEALAALDVDLRAVVVCRLVLDWSVRDTADALDLPPGTVKSRLHRALAQLHDALAHLR
ncbi:MAG: sigma factor-like helix-turn-helix DNA-binding protein [Actinomycetota bacterium]|nr:sigma factor-like helix-turn-helix DNA-binding protein [Actinomycetota bacterium]